MKKILAACIAVGLSAAAYAHPGHAAVAHDSALSAGFLHPLTGADHILALTAVGLWAAGFQGKARLALPAAFVLTMAAGFVFNLSGSTSGFAEQMIAASVLLLGLAAAWARQIPVAAAAVIAAVFAFFHGAAHGAELEGNAVLFGAGFLAATVLLHIAGYAAGRMLSANVWLNRIAGTAVGAAGLAMLLG